jgi:hypothetical protein
MCLPNNSQCLQHLPLNITNHTLVSIWARKSIMIPRVDSCFIQNLQLQMKSYYSTNFFYYPRCSFANMYQNSWNHYLNLWIQHFRTSIYIYMELSLYNTIFNILIYIFWKLEINVMNKKYPKFFFNNCNHYFYNVKGFIPNFWQILILLIYLF